MAVEALEGTETARGALHVVSVKRGRFPEEVDAVIAAGDGEVARVKHFGGRRSAGIPPWIEAGVVRNDEGLLREVVARLAGLLPAGGRLMILYGDDETERGLKRRFPPVVTPVGKALFDAGCTWFKDWYYPEGWMEGQFKLQGNLPASDEARTAQLDKLRARVRDWLDAAPDDEIGQRAARRGEEVLAA